VNAVRVVIEIETGEGRRRVSMAGGAAVLAVDQDEGGPVVILAGTTIGMIWAAANLLDIVVAEGMGKEVTSLASTLIAARLAGQDNDTEIMRVDMEKGSENDDIN
jgi:hypothetical protein